ncbi:MAG: class D beta-lactamase [Hyphomicrobiales bacterium]|nr:class D beta-lactamase [Hyphomicrobiales bacterium]
MIDAPMAANALRHMIRETVMTAAYNSLTRRTFLKSVTSGAAMAAISGLAHARETSEREDLAALFRNEGLEGCFSLYLPSTDSLTLVNAKRAATRFTPASTFKIPNSLIALETGVVRDENEIIPYGGMPQPIKSWEKDMGLADAIKISNVPIYQEIARRVGIETYRRWLRTLDYGNQDCGEVVDRFWLDGPLAISAVEQCRFLARLAQGQLPVSARSQTIIRKILEIESKNGRTLFAKTGWAFKAQKGWWAGWIEHDGALLAAFALNINMQRAEDAPRRISIGKALLSELDVY